jgi:hypothetical protein
MSEIDKLVYEWYLKNYPQWVDDEKEWHDDLESILEGGRG